VACDRLPGNAEALAAISAITEQTPSDLVDQFHAHKNGRDPVPAAPDAVRHHLRLIDQRVRSAPILDIAQTQLHREALDALMSDPPARTTADLAAWSHLIRHIPESIPTLDREPVQMPTLDEPQEAAWQVLLDLEDQRTEPWVLVGGQMTMLHCLENGLVRYRATDDGDVVLGVWTRRDALKTTSSWLQQQHQFTQADTSDGFGYRFERGKTKIDLLIPEGMDRQRTKPRTSAGRPGLAIEGGNQALSRAERLPVRLGSRTGHVRRPNILGALVLKAAAYNADSRDRERHSEDLALLTDIAITTGLRGIADRTTAHDRKRLRLALEQLPVDHRSWRLSSDPTAAHEALDRLANP
jgi:hypothetical protein